MGLFASKGDKKDSHGPRGKVNNRNVITNYEDRQYLKLQKSYEEDFDIFLINQLLLSVQFFENYEQEREIFSNTKSINNLNTSLLKDYRKSCIKPDFINDIVNKHVRFKIQKNGSNFLEPLLHKRMYILPDDIEIIPLIDENHTYDVIDTPPFKAVLRKSKSKGYVKLKKLRDSKQSSLSSTSSSSLSSDDALNGQEENDYSRINEARTPKEINPSTEQKSTTFQADSILTVVENTENSKDQKKEIKITEYFLNSKKMMEQFVNSLQTNYLEVLDLKDITSITRTSFSVFCTNKHGDETVNWEIIPSLSIQFPMDHALNFVRRGRTRKVGNSFYMWPIKTISDKIKKTECIVMPRGYMPKLGHNKEEDLEWEIGYPKIENYLEKEMKHVHVRAFLFLVVLFKTFVEPQTQYKGLLLNHLRTHMFWELENDVIDFNERNLGEKLLGILKNLNNKLGKSEMFDYLIDDRNLFANIPGCHMRKAQETFFDIIEMPVMKIIIALKQLEYKSANFYPMLNYDQLCSLLIIPTKEAKSPQKERNNRRTAVTVTKTAKKPTTQENLNEHIKWKSSQNLNMPKKSEIAQFFLEHFLKMAEHSLRYNLQEQTLVFTNHCKNFTRLLESHHNVFVKAFNDRINKIEAAAHSIKNENSAPSTPSRNSQYISNAFVVNATTMLNPQRLQEQLRQSDSISTNVDGSRTKTVSFGVEN